MGNNLTVIDFFCGAGGFSEGFRQQGFDIIKGVDNWKPSIDTFNYNFELNDMHQDIRNFENTENIKKLPDTNIILGSPPCVSFSNSNKSGYANKTLGIVLIEIFLKIVAVKKHQPGSKLKAWYMENVVNSIKYMKEKYTFKDLDLINWANHNDIDPSQVAIDFKNNFQILNSADFCVAQARKRLFAGEIVAEKSFPKLNANQSHKSIRQVFKSFPNPFEKQANVTDPNYKYLKIEKLNLTDHFYDSGIYKSHSDYSQYCKISHPYMGKMAFPENFDNPSRTVTATKLDNSRESLIYKSEINRVGDGQYRTPTVREIAILMSFPITYQFLGTSESAKWRLVGNAVCPLVSGGIAKATLQALNLEVLNKPIITKSLCLRSVTNLNTFTKRQFDSPPIRKRGSRFRRHPFKVGNMTVALSNYCLTENGKSDEKWRTTVTYGTGKGYKLQEVEKDSQRKIGMLIKKFHKGSEFIEKIQNGFSEKIAHAGELQRMYERGCSSEKLHPIDLLEQTKQLVDQYTSNEIVDTQDIFKYKNQVHMRQLYALYAINQITKIANRRIK